MTIIITILPWWSYHLPNIRHGFVCANSTCCILPNPFCVCYLPCNSSCTPLDDMPCDWFRLEEEELILIITTTTTRSINPFRLICYCHPRHHPYKPIMYWNEKLRVVLASCPPIDCCLMGVLPMLVWIPYEDLMLCIMSYDKCSNDNNREQFWIIPKQLWTTP